MAWKLVEVPDTERDAITDNELVLVCAHLLYSTYNRHIIIAKKIELARSNMKSIQRWENEGGATKPQDSHNNEMAQLLTTSLNTPCSG